MAVSSVAMLLANKGVTAVTRSFAAATGNGSDLTTYTFTAHAIGAAASNRKVVVAATGRMGSGIQVSSLTVGGVSATSAVSSGSGTSHSSIWVVDFPTGTTADIVVTFSGGAARCAVAVWAMYGAGSSTPTATATDTTSPFSQSLTTPVGGVAFGVITSSDPAGITWANLTEDVDANYPDASQLYSAGSKESVAGDTSTITASPTDGAMCLAAFGP